MRVAITRDAAMLALLLSKGAEVNAQNNQGETALTRLASYGGGSGSPTAKQAVEAAKVLIDKGADVNMTTQYGETILMRALGNSNKELASLLIEKGADLSPTRPGSEPPLFRIIGMGDNDLLTLAIQKKADLNIKDSAGNTPLMRAVMYGDGKTELVEALIKAGADINAQNLMGQTALDLVRRGNNEVIELLKAHGAKPANGDVKTKEAGRIRTAF
jgi:ankyrin repeat protein